jgi:hypothetical protein
MSRKEKQAYERGHADGVYLREIGEIILAGGDPDGLLRIEYLAEMEHVVKALPAREVRETTFTSPAERALRQAAGALRARERDGGA